MESRVSFLIRFGTKQEVAGTSVSTAHIHASTQYFRLIAKPSTKQTHYFAEFSKNGTSFLVIPRSDDFKSNFTIRFKKISRGGKEYLEVTKFQLQFTAANAKLQFDNLFGGNKALGNTMNKFLNENWEEIVNELAPALAQAFGVAMKAVSNKILTQIPFEEINL